MYSAKRLAISVLPVTGWDKTKQNTTRSGDRVFGKARHCESDRARRGSRPPRRADDASREELAQGRAD